MKKIIIPGILAGIVLLVLSVGGLYATVWLFPNIAMQYFAPAFDDQAHRYLLYFIHPFIIALALSWFWNRFKGALTGKFITKGIEFAAIYLVISIIPMMWLIYSSISVSLSMLGTWLVFGLLQGVFAGLVFEKINP